LYGTVTGSAAALYIAQALKGYEIAQALKGYEPTPAGRSGLDRRG
jgi:hypothetical protein